MKLTRDYFNNVTPPEYILEKADNSKIGEIYCTKKELTLEFNSYNEITFTTPLYINEEKNPIYNYVVEHQYVELPLIGKFILEEVAIKSEGEQIEVKECTAKSIDTLLSQKYFCSFNNSEDEDYMGTVLYNPDDLNHSLLNIVLNNSGIYGWKIGYVEAGLWTMLRIFDISRQDAYSFLTKDMSEAFGCVVLFDTLRQEINVYDKDSIGKDTGIFLSYQNLLKSTTITYSTDDIKTCLSVSGADEDDTFRSVNMGYDKIYNFDYFVTPEFMSDELINAFTEWRTKWNNNVEGYKELSLQYCITSDETLHETDKMPDDPESTDWEQYGSEPLQEKVNSLQAQITAADAAGWDDQDTASTDEYNKYLSLTSQFEEVEAAKDIQDKKVADLEAQCTSLKNQMNEISNTLKLENNFTESQLAELNKFVREDELSSSNYAISEAVSNEDMFNTMQEMLDFAQKELVKVAQPQITFSAEIANIYENEEFDSVSDEMEVGNYVSIIIRDDYIVKARLLKTEINFSTKDIELTFSNISRLKDRNIFTDIADAMNTATSAATSVSFNSSHWDEANKEATNISRMLESGLLGQGMYLSSTTEQSELLINKQGIYVNTIDDGVNHPDSIFIGGGRILFSTDNWNTVRQSVGRANVTRNGKTTSEFGVFADFCIGSYIAGSVIEGNQIYVGGEGDKNGKLTVYNTNGEPTVILDHNGITMGEGTMISWDNISGTDGIATKDDAQTYANTALTNAKTYADGVANTAKIDSVGTFEKYLKGEITLNGNYFNPTITTITKETVTAPYIQAMNLYVGEGGIKMSDKATISWGKITGTPDVATKTEAQTYANTAESNAKKAIPTKVSQLDNDSSFAKTSSLPKNLSELTNDTEYITASSLPSDADIVDIIKENKGTIITKDYIGTLKVVAGSVAAENITGTTITGKVFNGSDIRGGLLKSPRIFFYKNNSYYDDADPATNQIGSIMSRQISGTNDYELLVYGGKNLVLSTVSSLEANGVINADRILDAGRGMTFARDNATAYGWADWYYHASKVGSIYAGQGALHLTANNAISIDSYTIFHGESVFNNVERHHGEIRSYFGSAEDILSEFKGIIFSDQTGFSVESRNNYPLSLLSSNGTIYKYGALVDGSSIRYKENIQDITEEYANKLLELTPVEFDYKKDGRHALGLIAEDTDAIIPHIVVHDAEGRPDAIAYGELVPLLVKEIQILNERIKKLEEKTN